MPPARGSKMGKYRGSTQPSASTVHEQDWTMLDQDGANLAPHIHSQSKFQATETENNEDQADIESQPAGNTTDGSFESLTDSEVGGVRGILDRTAKRAAFKSLMNQDEEDHGYDQDELFDAGNVIPADYFGDNDEGDEVEEQPKSSEPATQAQDEKVKHKYRMTNYFKQGQGWRKLEGVSAELEDARFRFTPGPSGCIRAIMFDYDLAKDRLEDTDITAINKLHAERDAVIEHIKEIFAEVNSSAAGYTSEAPFMRRTKAAVRKAVRAEIRRFRGIGSKQTREEATSCLPKKVEILAVRFMDPRSFNGLIATMLAFLGRTDLMVCGVIEPKANVPSWDVVINKFNRQDADVAALRASLEATRAKVDDAKDKANDAVTKASDTKGEVNVEKMRLQEALNRVAALEGKLEIQAKENAGLQVAVRQMAAALKPRVTSRVNSLEYDEVEPVANLTVPVKSTAVGRSSITDAGTTKAFSGPSRASVESTRKPTPLSSSIATELTTKPARVSRTESPSVGMDASVAKNMVTAKHAADDAFATLTKAAKLQRAATPGAKKSVNTAKRSISEVDSAEKKAGKRWDSSL